MQTRLPWTFLSAKYEEAVQGEGSRYASEHHARQDRAFLLDRFAEGRAIAGLLTERLGTGLRILDLGTGNAGVALAVANTVGNAVVALDSRFNDQARRFARDHELPLRYLVASGLALPVSDAAFDAVLCLETVEHLPEPNRLGAEIMRVLRPGGICVLTTPARLRFLFRRDPHFAIPGLLLLPDRLQRWLVTKVARVVPPGEYDVVHIYWYAGSLARLFPSRAWFQAVGSPPEHALARWGWSVLQRVAWTRCLVGKAGDSSA